MPLVNKYIIYLSIKESSYFFLQHTKKINIFRNIAYEILQTGYFPDILRQSFFHTMQELDRLFQGMIR